MIGPRRERLSRNARIVTARLAGKTLREIADEQGMKISRVSQVLRAYEKRNRVRLVKVERRVYALPLDALGEAS